MTDDELFAFMDELDAEESAKPPETPQQKRQRLLPHKQNAVRVQQELDDEEAEKTNFGVSNALGAAAKGIVSGTPVGSFLDELVGVISGDSKQQDFRDASKAREGDYPFIDAFSPIIGAALPFGAAKTIKGSAGIGALSGLIHGAGNEENRLGSAVTEGAIGAAAGGGGAALGSGIARGIRYKNPVAILEDLVGSAGTLGDKLKALRSKVSIEPKSSFSAGPVSIKVQPEMQAHPVTSSNVRKPRTTDVPAGYKDEIPFTTPAEEPSIGTLSSEQIPLARQPSSPETVSLSLEDLKQSAMDDDILFPRVNDQNWGSEADSPAARLLMNDLIKGKPSGGIPSPGEEGEDILNQMMPKDLDARFPKITADEDMPSSTSLMSQSKPKPTTEAGIPSKKPTRPAEPEPINEQSTEFPESDVPQQSLEEESNLFSNPGVEEQLISPSNQPGMITPEQFQAEVMKLQSMGYDIQSIFAMLEGKQPPPADYMAMAARGSNKPGQARAIAQKDQGTYKPKKKEPKRRPTFNPPKPKF
jgi:hypothetical protein